MKNFLLKLFSVMFIVCVCTTTFVFADEESETTNDGVGNGFDRTLIPSEDPPVAIMKPVYKIWNTIIVVIRIAAFAGIIFAGVRYLYASADQKADLKKSLVPLVIGMVFVFASTILLDFIVKIFYDVTKI